MPGIDRRPDFVEHASADSQMFERLAYLLGADGARHGATELLDIVAILGNRDGREADVLIALQRAHRARVAGVSEPVPERRPAERWPAGDLAESLSLQEVERRAAYGERQPEPCRDLSAGQLRRSIECLEDEVDDEIEAQARGIERRGLHRADPFDR